MSFKGDSKIFGFVHPDSRKAEQLSRIARKEKNKVSTVTGSRASVREARMRGESEPNFSLLLVRLC